MKRLIRRIFVIVMMTLTLMIMMVVKSEAGLQANPNTHYRKESNTTYWATGIRNMEKLGEAMGLNEILNTNLTPQSDSNDIDVHFMRSTEYGAIAILSASGYGNPQTLQQSALKTTTGNKTGIYFSGGNWEWVAGSTNRIPIATGIDSRYQDDYADIYDVNKASKKGDALGTNISINPGCAGWHNAVSKNWPGGASNMLRRGGDGLFSFNSSYNYNSAYGRGVAVCGSGI
ncbi:MAG: hypothetical protein HFJ59_02625 [Clostridia bacterium]|nr:hypothetical protein [Clostridia bacterium]